MPAEAIRIETGFGPVRCSRVDALTVYRVGYKPDPWHWTPWEFADEHGRFTGRWDDPAGVWRTLYAGSSALACYLEVLAVFRADPDAARDMDDIVVDDGDDLYPTVRAGQLPRAWCESRLMCSAELSGPASPAEIRCQLSLSCCSRSTSKQSRRSRPDCRGLRTQGDDPPA